MAEPTSPVARMAAAVAMLPDDHPLRPTAEMLEEYCADLEAALARSPLRSHPAEPYRPPPEVVARFTSEVADVAAELAKLAPRMLAAAGHYVALRDHFNESIVPREVRLQSDEPVERLWAETGGQQLADRFDELVQQLAAAAELRVW